ncbi:hypothetical protein [Sphingobacterium spiritivorum]|uniref:hypothetical protein n=1 Tax=Sphingobacterium spiritivorum TaxID=258 RepID=UPI001918518B|nr:hypothetical protein [Sphingobacterium spiritivorum]QQT24271.1 hypothetical protein I6J02_10870 [Sphingobacterium spiritivorum]
MRKYIFALGLFWIIPFLGLAQSSDKDLPYIRKFVHDLSVDSIATDVLLSQYVTVNKEVDDDYLDYLVVSLDEVRLNIQNKNINEIEYLNWNQIPKKETRDIDPEGLDVNNMYFLKYKGRQVVALYLENGKIASFTLVSKGNRTAHFVTY